MRTKKWHVIYILLVIILVSFAYLNHFHNAFHFDDFHTIVNNPHIKELSFDKVKTYFTDVSTFSNMPTNQGYRPIVTLSLAIDYFIAGEMNPFYFHLSMFFWFIVQLIFMFFLFRYLLRKVSDFWGISLIVFFTVLWYGLHTANAETINYIIMRGDSLSTMLIIVGLYLYVQYKSIRKYGLYLIPVVLAILTKQTAVMFFPIQFVYVLLFEQDASLYNLFNRKGVFKNTFVKTLPSFLVCLVFGYIVFVMQRDEAMVEISNIEYMITQPWVMLRYFVLFFFPVSLSADTDWQVFQSVFDVRAIVGIVFVASLIIYAFKTSKQKETRPISFGILWFFLALMPTSSFIALTQVTNDHRMFFPFVGLSLAVVWNIALIIKKHEAKIKSKYLFKILIIAVPVIVLALNAYGTYKRNQIWSSNESLWYDVTVKSPRNARGLMNYGLVKMEQGNYKEALEYFNKALLLEPDYFYLHINLGILKNAMGKPDEAEAHFKRTLKYLSQASPSYYYARFLKSQGRIDEAINHCKRSINISYSHMQARHLLMDLYFHKQEKEHLIKLINETLEINSGDAFAKAMQEKVKTIGQSKLEQLKSTAQHQPSPENYLNLSLEYYHHEMYEACIEACYKALEIKSDYALAYNNICSAYNRLGEYEKAIEACEKALSINPEFQRAKNNLNHAYKMQAN
ncbi:MAG: tetratricopeptide repeat protein [Bacteroidota bacterium]|nr:tetratricopeptide repeat protein [Bacteroidota bacterium]